MKRRPSDYPELSSTEFRDMVLGSVPNLGYSVGSVTVDGENAIKITASIPSKSLDNGVLINVVRGGRKLDLSQVTGFLEEVSKGNYFEGVLVASSGFTKGALEYASGSNLKLILLSDLSAFKAGEASKPVEKSPVKEHRIFELVFKTSKTIDDAKAYFELVRSKKILGFFGTEEKVTDVRGRFAPVGCFEVSSQSSPSKPAETFNVYVNLSSGAMYFVHLGSVGSKPGVRQSFELLKLLRLAPEALRVLHEINLFGEIDARKISGENLSLIQNNPSILYYLNSMGLIISQPNYQKFISNLHLPSFSGARYDLSKYFTLDKSVESSFEADEIEVSPRNLVVLLENLLNSQVYFKGITYMLYFACKFVDDHGMSRVDFMLTPEFDKSG